MAPTGGPHLSAAEREGRWEAGRVGRNGDVGRAEKRKKRGKVRWAAELGLFLFFQILFKPFQTFLLYLFKSNFNTNSPTILRLLENLLTSFQTFLNSNFRHFFLIQTFTPIFTIFLRIFSQKFLRLFTSVFLRLLK
jgi:hypothetical protein